MKNTNIFYRILKIGMIVADVFIACVLTALCVLTFISQEEFSIALMLSLAFVFGFSIIEIFLLKYYQNIVISIDFIEDCVVVYTNKKKYILPKKYFTLVKEQPANGRTYILYNDGICTKKFVYIMRYAFKTYRLDILEMKKHMPYTKFE